jgi:hypothetical protein
MVSPYKTTKSRKTPCAAGCCGPKFNVKVLNCVEFALKNILTTIATKIRIGIEPIFLNLQFKTLPFMLSDFLPSN